MPGVYDVLYEAVASGSLAPANPQIPLRTGVAIGASGRIDFDVPAVTASGSFTVAGAAPPGSAYDTGRISLRPVAGGAPVLLGSTHEQTYQRRIVAGRYDVLYAVVSSQNLVPFNSEAVIARDVLFDGSARDIDVPLARLAATLTLNGAAFPASEYDMGEIWAADAADGSLTRLGGTHWGNFDVALVPGTYDLVYRAVNAGALTPRNRYAIVREDVVVSGSTSLDVDVVAHRVRGPITLDGDPFPAPAYDYARIEAMDLSTGDRVPLGVGSLDRFSTRVLEGVYDLRYTHVSGDDVPRNQDANLGCVNAIVPR